MQKLSLMNDAKKILMLLILMTCASACHQNQDKNRLDQNGIARAIENTLLDYHKAIHKNGLLGELPYLDSSAQFFWIPPGYQSAINYDSVVFILKQNAGLFSTISHQMDTLSVQAINSENALYHLKLNTMMIDTAGRKTSMKLLESGHMVRRSDGWKLLCGHTTVLE